MEECAVRGSGDEALALIAVLPLGRVAGLLSGKHKPQGINGKQEDRWGVAMQMRFMTERNHKLFQGHVLSLRLCSAIAV